MSFGYYDNEWIDPPDPDFESEYGEIVIEFNKDKILWDGESIEFQDPSVKFEDFYDDQYGSFVADGDRVAEYTLEALYEYMPKEEGYYLLTGWVYIPYNVLVPARLPKYEQDYGIPEAELEGTSTAGEIKIDPAE